MSPFNCYDVHIEAKNIALYKDVEWTRSARERTRWIVKVVQTFMKIYSKAQNIRTGYYYLIWSGLTGQPTQIVYSIYT